MHFYEKRNVAADNGTMAILYSKNADVRNWFRDMVIVLDEGGVLDEDLRSRGKLTRYLGKWNDDNLNGFHRYPSIFEQEGNPSVMAPLFRAINKQEALWKCPSQVGRRILDDILDRSRSVTIEGKKVPLLSDTGYEVMNCPNWSLIEKDPGAWVERVLAVWTAEMWPYFLTQDLGNGRRGRAIYLPREARRIITIGR